MKRFFQGPLNDNARNLMRRMGYGEHRGHENQLSYARRVSGQLFPRYHAYVEDRDGGIQINLHVDQKEASYSGTSAHSGEYNGPLVDSEMQRIAQFIATTTSKPVSAPDATQTKTKKGFWGNLP